MTGAKKVTLTRREAITHARQLHINDIKTTNNEITIRTVPEA